MYTREGLGDRKAIENSFSNLLKVLALSPLGMIHPEYWKDLPTYGTVHDKTIGAVKLNNGTIVRVDLDPKLNFGDGVIVYTQGED